MQIDILSNIEFNLDGQFCVLGDFNSINMPFSVEDPGTMEGKPRNMNHKPTYSRAIFILLLFAG